MISLTLRGRPDWRLKATETNEAPVFWHGAPETIAVRCEQLSGLVMTTTGWTHVVLKILASDAPTAPLMLEKSVLAAAFTPSEWALATFTLSATELALAAGAQREPKWLAVYALKSDGSHLPLGAGPVYFYDGGDQATGTVPEGETALTSTDLDARIGPLEERVDDLEAGGTGGLGGLVIDRYVDGYVYLRAAGGSVDLYKAPVFPA